MDTSVEPYGVTPSAASQQADATRRKSSLKKVEEDSWTSVERQELDHATSYVSESMYLVMENPVSSLYVGEGVLFKAHAQCDKSTIGLAGVTLAAASVTTKHGTLFLTNYRLLFLSFHGPDKEGIQDVVEVHLNNIAELYEGRVTAKNGTSMSQLEISCKNFEIVKFNFPLDFTSGELFVRINKALAVKQQQVAYACVNVSSLPDVEGWRVYDAQTEFQRLGFKSPKSTHLVTGFRVTTINSNYKMCPTYPGAFVVPAALSDGELRKMSHFRARGRIPAVTYRYRNDAVIARCAQPLVGLRRKRCAADEAYVAALRRESNGRLLFVDCRSQTSAYGNIALGGGFEVLDYYKDTNIMFMGIENIHSMRDSIRKLFDLIKYEVRGNERSNWLSCLEGTRWLEHVRSILVSSAACVTKVVEEGTSLVVHCSDGWDRTAQICALTKLCIDPFYRTLKGFQVLIEQEWCAFGHQFRARTGHSSDRSSYWEDDASSPVFMQFIDAVWQLMRQFPCSFEINERYLIALLDEVYTKRSGTFLHDCEESRMGSMTITRCTSVWSLLAQHEQTGDFMNPFYIVPLEMSEGSTDRSPTVLQFKWHTSSLAIWSAFYLRSLESNDSRDAWAKELQVTQRELQEQLSNAHQKLQSQVDANSELHLELEILRKESARLRSALEGQVFNDATRGLCVHEEDDDDDGVLLSVTSVRSSAPLTIPGSSNQVRSSRSGSGSSSHGAGSLESSGFIGASISPSFEILQSYFDVMRMGSPSFPPRSSSTISSSSSSSTGSAGSSCSAASSGSSASVHSAPMASHPRMSTSKSCSPSLMPSTTPGAMPALRILEDYAAVQ
ncbi:hypothetical protein Poli38472_011279 [Pythium oligandrum]|uniref:Phosphatidylinositol-3,5-bisphosphate 3-phosphatase n=1 Tax=Pythium oligandrum TaxID=41045 RepID=A0A8K1CQB1_PYTOL|nr:hypothetical protein Poli38472_011279 [Pythium oligandrum]|eukprot:TMW67659.1 hypothetical protein Poli38472_011279 [Pythium oligandrum]